MGHEHGEAFPREETRDLVGEALRAEQRRAWLQDLAIALALALLALGSPTERLLEHPLPFLSERAGFGIAGVAFALGWLVLVRASRRNGWEAGAALRASLAAAALPPVLLAATTPGPRAICWLGGCLAVALATVDARRPLRVIGWIASSLCLCAVLPPGWLSTAALAPLAWLGQLELEKRGRRAGWATIAALVLGLGAIGWTRWTDPERDWRARAEEQLEPRDLVLTYSREHAYLLSRRYELKTFWLYIDLELDREVEAARAAGGRVVLDETGLSILPEDVRGYFEALADVRLPAR